MSVVIITPKEDVDYQFWYPKRNRVIRIQIHKRQLPWSDEVEKESASAKSATSPKIYDLRTPQKKSETKKKYSSDSSDSMFETIKSYEDTEDTKQSKRVVDSKPISSSNRTTSIPVKTNLSLVDKILLEESSCTKHSKTGSVNKAKKL